MTTCRPSERTVYLFMALFWLVVGVTLQVFWDALESRRFIPLSRNLVGVFCFVLFSYNFIRWRLARAQQQAHADRMEPPPRSRRADPDYYDPTFDFSEPTPDDEKKKDPPV